MEEVDKMYIKLDRQKCTVYSRNSGFDGESAYFSVENK